MQNGDGFIMQRRFLQIFTVTLIIFLSRIDTQYIYAGTLKGEAGSYRDKGYQAQQRGDTDAAINWYQKAVRLDMDYAAPHNDLGILYETKGWLDRAESEYKKALAIDPNYEMAHTNLALLYEKKGEIEKAAFHWMRRYKLSSPGDPWAREARQRLEKLGLLYDIEKEKAEKPIKIARQEEPKTKIEKKKPKKGKEEKWSRIGSKSREETLVVRKDKPVKVARQEKPRAKIKKKRPKKKSSKWTRIGSKPKEKEDFQTELQRSLALAEERLRGEKRKKKSLDRELDRKERFDSQSSRSSYIKARNFYKKGEYSRALDAIRTAKRDSPKDKALLGLEQEVKSKMKEERIDDHYREGIMNYQKKDFPAARREFEAILNILPE